MYKFLLCFYFTKQLIINVEVGFGNIPGNLNNEVPCVEDIRKWEELIREQLSYDSVTLTGFYRISELEEQP